MRFQFRRLLGWPFALVLAAAFAACAARVCAGNAPGVDDPYLWLEDVDGARAMNWVKAENSKTVAVLEKDARYAKLYADALALAEAKDRIPLPSFVRGQIYNFWQDADHTRGIWRRSSLAEYGKQAPDWTTVLDLDALAQTEHGNWFWKGADCLKPEERFCLVSLSDGGEDAVSVRELDLTTNQFLKGGFDLPKSKQSIAWLDADRLLVARDWGAGTMTESGYPFVVRTLKRGESVAAAQEVFRGTPHDVEVDVARLEDGDDHRATLILRRVSFFEVETYLVSTQGVQRLALPLKSEVLDLLAGRLLIKLNESWKTPTGSFGGGALVSVDLAAATADPTHLSPVLVYSPGPRESLGDVAATRSRVVLTLYRNVKGRALIYTPDSGGGWSQRTLALPDNLSLDVMAADLHSERAFLNVTGFLTPSSLWLVDAGAGTLEEVKALPAKFDASNLRVEQREAKSKDGTMIPYFVVHPQGMPLDGSNPTILTAYGGFQVSNTPYYSATIGKLWMERGGVFVVANIRGGGEFGPAWHEAGLKTHRQRIYDDFTAVAEDLIASQITSPRRLGIEGGSNGGLLVGVELTQHPELWNAVDIQVPLLDMLRYEKIAAGSSWVGEYGSVSVPRERTFLASISPYQNLKPGIRYPEPFIWTTTKDDRVGPQHARKFAAKLAALGDPYLFYEVIEGGHAAGANLKEQARTRALEMTYFSEKLMDR
jgi:prolyl oligopeptidase